VLIYELTSFVLVLLAWIDYTIKGLLRKDSVRTLGVVFFGEKNILWHWVDLALIFLI
jgi:hypothetical protein